MSLQFYHIKKLATLVIVASLIVLANSYNTTVQAGDEGYYKVINVPKYDVLNIRKYSNHRSRKVGSIPRTEEYVMVIGRGYRRGRLWFKVNYRGVVG